MLFYQGRPRHRQRAFLLWILVLALLPLAAGHSYRQGYFRFAYPLHAEFPVRGTDVSHHQGRIDWTLVDLNHFMGSPEAFETAFPRRQ